MKLFNIIATSLLGTAMAIGAGLALVNKQEMKQAKAAETLEATYDLSSSVPSTLTASEDLTKDSTRGMGKAGVTYTITTKSSFESVTRIVVQAATNYTSYTMHTIGVTVGGNAFDSTKGFAAQSLTEYTFSPGSTADGAIVITFTNYQPGTTKSNTIWVKNIKVYTGTPVEPITVAAARGIISGLADGASTADDYTVKGYITKITYTYTAANGVTFLLGDALNAADADTITCFKVKDSNSKIAVGAQVSLSGKLQKYVKSGVTTPELTGATSVTIIKEAGELDAITTIQGIYSGLETQPVDVYGYYVGFLDGTGPIIMNGSYGIVTYAKTHVVSSYTENETILHITGSVSIFNGLYEISGSVNISEVASAVGTLDIPVTYAVQGGESNPNVANRATTLNGYVTAVDGDLELNAGVSDLSFTAHVGSNDVTVFYKKAAQTNEDMEIIADSLANGTVITVKGFTSWHGGFQVQMSGIIPAAADYTATMFAQDLLNQTDAVCTGYVAGDNNHDALATIWLDLNSADKYQKLPSDQKTALHDASANESGTVIEQAMARYDHICKAYKLTNFIDRNSAKWSSMHINILGNNNNVVPVIIITSVIIAISFAGVLISIRRRKHQ